MLLCFTLQLRTCAVSTGPSGGLPRDYIEQISGVKLDAASYDESGLANVTFPQIYSSLEEARDADIPADMARFVAPLFASYLAQLGLAPADVQNLTAEGSSVLGTSVFDILSLGADGDPAPVVPRRALLGFFSAIKRFFRKVVKAVEEVVTEAPKVLVDIVEDVASDIACRAFATASTPAYMLAFYAFSTNLLVHAPQQLTTDQRYFVHPVHGRPTFAGVVYNATFPGDSRFGRPWDAGAVTMPGVFYTRSRRLSYPADGGGFIDQAALANHELAHIRQYRQRLNIPQGFGWDYLFAYCKAGFSYANNRFEVEARRDADRAADLYPQRRLFECWRDGGFVNSIGFPTATSVVQVPPRITETLRCQFGSFDARCNAFPDADVRPR